MEALTLTVPWPPSVNHYWRSIPMRRSGGTRGTRVVLSRAGRAYRENVRGSLRMPADVGGPLQGRLHVAVTLHPPTHRKIDIDNRMKALLDALQHAGVYRDDGQIDRLEIERSDVIKGGAAVVTIAEFHPPSSEAQR